MLNDTTDQSRLAVGAADPDRVRIEAHWRDIGGATGIPHHDAIDLGVIAPVLDRVMMLDRAASRDAQIRLAGQGLVRRFGMDLRHTPLCEVLAPASRDWLGDAVQALFDLPARIELGLTGPRRGLRPRARASLLLLPLRDRSGTINRALGYVTLPDPSGSRGPLRFGIAGETRRPLQDAVPERTERSDMFDHADRARDVMRRRRRFHVVQD